MRIIEGEPSVHRVVGVLLYEGVDEKKILDPIGEFADRIRNTEVLVSASIYKTIGGINDLVELVGYVVTKYKTVITKVLCVYDLEKVGRNNIELTSDTDKLLKMFGSMFVDALGSLGFHDVLFNWLHHRIIVAELDGVKVLLAISGSSTIPSIEYHVIELLKRVPWDNNVDIDRRLRLNELHSPCTGSCLDDLKRRLKSLIRELKDFMPWKKKPKKLSGYRDLVEYLLTVSPRLVKESLDHLFELVVYAISS
ncbi:MAG: hypothetical protein DRO40_11030 [Thermoprotei archaeon]|nr:MAG: hypothetical protein DRO40_11030 [Thermoprotei archaeon]